MKREEAAFLRACEKSKVEVRLATEEELNEGLYLCDDEGQVFVVSKDKNAKPNTSVDVSKKTMLTKSNTEISASAAKIASKAIASSVGKIDGSVRVASSVRRSRSRLLTANVSRQMRRNSTLKSSKNYKKITKEY